MKLSSAAPSAARLTSSLRDIGYDFVSAIADLIDNSISAGATDIAVEIEFAGRDSAVFIADNGCGLTARGMTEALRFGSRRTYGSGDLGRYGLGLKTASLSQGRCLTIVTRPAERKRPLRRSLDLDLIAEFDDWVLAENPRDHAVARSEEMLGTGTGTVVVWQNLDRVLPASGSEGGWAKRRFENLVVKTKRHLAMVFHRFLTGEKNAARISIRVNGDKLLAWDPFVRHEPGTQELPPQQFELESAAGVGTVGLRRYILPGKATFSSVDAFEDAAGPLKWNRQQGLYVYRENRLVQWGSWAGTRGIDEHTKLARASLDFTSTLDEVFNINVAKMRVAVPAQLKQMLDRPVSELCILADRVYRRHGAITEERGEDEIIENDDKAPTNGALSEVGLALKSAAIQSGEYDGFKKVMRIVCQQHPDLGRGLGF
ncbi:ATP-binding protein [Mycolicibacillus parakoreensis]|uniref:ATP-binding protein n=1 Tax=Mycolicibacillus parakoreensis TaxID=1069221 RepID=A0ABY3TX35_9MYCO|nr:ATP-binding protein [Mycolicibacillus parakoreensis]MCV7316132.1 ATP-binding protein [Mycolicibacillus parakoreensis]ULN52253.1 ATP-binding protein [Mycolicibacillus parakoreensis]